MPSHSESRELPFAAGQMFALVADVGRYPEFLPWVVGARVRSDQEEEMIADLIVGFRGLREQFTSRVRKDRPTALIVDYLDGPLERLRNEWRFTDLPGAQARCRVDFHVDFAFRARVFERLAGQMFHRALARMIGAFTDRAHAVYGAPGVADQPGSSSFSAVSVA